jgi:hypothetical protein
VIEISLEKRCLHIDRTTGAIAQAACSRTAMQPAHMERLELLTALHTLLQLLKAKVGDAAARLRTASLIAVAITGRPWGSLLVLPPSQEGRSLLPLLTGKDSPHACHFFQLVILCHAA